MPMPARSDYGQHDEIVCGIQAARDFIISKPNAINRIYIAAGQQDKDLYELLKLCRKERMPYQVVPPLRLTDIAANSQHQGIVIQCSTKEFADADVLMKDIASRAETPLILVPASIEDPRNLGALVRSAVAFGVSAMFLERKNSVPLNTTVAKASAGTLEHMPIARPRNLEAILGECKSNGYRIVGAIAGSEKRPSQIDFSGPIVIIVGGEHRGIPPYLHALCTDFVSIPTATEVQSLNVSVAAAILLYECASQRVGGTKYQA